MDSRIVCSKSFVSAIEEAPEENKLSLTQDCPEIEGVRGRVRVTESERESEKEKSTRRKRITVEKQKKKQKKK